MENTNVKINVDDNNTTQASNIPSTQKMVETTEKARQTMEHERKHNPNIDEKGQSILRAAENLAGTTGEMFQEKNSDEAFQKFGQHCNELGNRLKKEMESKKGDLNQGDLEQGFEKISQMLPKFRSLITQLFTSVDSRGISLEFVSACSEITGTMAEKTKQTDEKSTTHAFDQLSREEKRKIVQKFTDIYARIGENQAIRDFRQQILDLYDFFRADNFGMGKKQIDPEIKKELTQLSNEALALLQRFVPGKDLKELNTRFWSLYSQINSDREVQTYFCELRKWADTIVRDPSLARDSGQVDKAVEMFDRGNTLVRSKYRDDLRRFFCELRQVFELMASDKYAVQMKQGMMEFREAISGSIVQTLGQLRNIALPLFKSMMVELNLPKIEATTDTSHYTLDHMAIKGKELGLEDFSLQMKVGLKDMFHLVVKVKNLQLTVSEINFTYERTSMPKWSDEGVCSASLHMPKFKLQWSVKEDKGQTPHFQLDDIYCKITQFNINIEEANHKLLDQMIVGLFQGSARTQAEESINETLRKNGDVLTQKLNQFFIEKAVIPSSAPSSSSTPSKPSTSLDRTKMPSVEQTPSHPLLSA